MMNPVFEDRNKHNVEKAQQMKTEFESLKGDFEKVQSELTDAKANFADLQSDKVALEEEVTTLKEFKENLIDQNEPLYLKWSMAYARNDIKKACQISCLGKSRFKLHAITRFGRRA